MISKEELKNLSFKNKTREKTDLNTTQKPKQLFIKLCDIYPFPNHPYKVADDDSMADLADSISENGIINPLIVRPHSTIADKYELISGHRRLYAAKKLGMKKVPCTVHYIDLDTAIIMMVDSNCQRTKLLPSEKAWAYKMRLDAMKRQGKRTDLFSAPVGPKLTRSNERLAEMTNESVTQIKRYIRLTNLIPELLQFVDDGKIAMRPAVEMSYLDEEIQRNIVDCIYESGDEVFPSHAQTRRIRQIAESFNGIQYKDIASIMKEQKPNQIPTFKISEKKIFEITNRRFTPKEFNNYIEKALESYERESKRQREWEAR